MKRRRIAVFSSGRADYGLLYWILQAMHESRDFEPLLVAAGMHLSPAHGYTVKELERAPWPIAARVECLVASDTGAGAARSLGLAGLGLADAFERLKPDMLLLLGDRYELLAAAGTALLMRIPIAHLHGGEVTLGAVDEQVRHSVTQLASLHLPATGQYARNLESMGEERWRIRVVGAPGLEWLRRVKLPGRRELERELAIDLGEPWLLVTYHPATLESMPPQAQIGELLRAVEASGLPALFTAPNADPGGLTIRAAVEQFVAARPASRRLLDSLGQQRYLGLMRHVRSMVGNSSSGIIEAPSLGLPVVNVGPRQDGRVRAACVIDTPIEAAAIRRAIERAALPAFRASLKGVANPYGKGDSSRRVLAALRAAPGAEKLLAKRRSFAV